MQRGASPPKTPTIRQIAAACGVNHSTVSRALSGSPLVADATRAKVQETARSMGWKPNPLASAYLAHLRSTRKPTYQATLAMLFDRSLRAGEKKMPLSVQEQFAAGRRRADAHGYKLEIFHLQSMGMNCTQLSKVLVARNIPGILLHGFGTPSSLDGLDWSRFAVVERKSYHLGYKFHRIVINAYHGFYMMICKAFALGYKRVGVCVSRQYDRSLDHGVLFPVTYAREHLRRGQSLEPLVLASHSARESTNIKRWLRKVKPEIVIGVDLVWNAIEDMGWKVPEDIAFINVDRRENFPHIAGFNQRIDVQVERAVDLLVSQVNANQRGVPEEPILQLVDGCWEDGASAPPAAKRQNKMIKARA